MKVATASLVLAASAAYAQNFSFFSPEALLSGLSPNCSLALFGLLSNSNLTTCINLPGLYNLFSMNGSIVPAFDSYLASTCSIAPCSNATLQSTASQLIGGCSSELSQYGVSNTTVYSVFNTYPLAREVACLKTSKPAAANFTNATIPINSTAYNTTNGTFCATSLLTELSGYLGQNLTLNNIFADVSNSSALKALEAIPPTAICQDCIYAAVDLIELQYPTVGTMNYTVSNTTFTVNGFFNSTCMANSTNTNGTLPSTIIPSAVNSTFPYRFTANGTTHNGTAAANSTSTNSTGTNSTSGNSTATTPASRKRVMLVRDFGRL